MNQQRQPSSPRHELARRAVSTLLLCVLIAGFLWLIGAAPFGRSLVYSVCIGACCNVFIDGSLKLLLRWQQRGLAPEQCRRWPSWPWTALCVGLGAVAGFTLGTWIADAITGMRSVSLFSGSPRALTLTLGLSLAASAAGTAWFRSRARLADSLTQAQTAQRAAAEAHLRLLESQLEPHMLFNTLANLRALIGIDPPRAQAMLDRLIAYLRATLTASRVPLHPLAAEFERLQDYLSLMGVRMGDRLQTQFHLPLDLQDHPVAPLLLQPLVENAIQHGLEPKVGGGRIEVSAQRDGAQLRLCVRDTGMGLGGGRPGTQFGTLQVRERLKALHGDAARFTLEAATDADGGTLACITLPLETTAP